VQGCQPELLQAQPLPGLGQYSPEMVVQSLLVQQVPGEMHHLPPLGGWHRLVPLGQVQAPVVPVTTHFEPGIEEQSLSLQQVPLAMQRLTRPQRYVPAAQPQVWLGRQELLLIVCWQFWQVVPRPQAVGEVPARQLVPEQQPPLHEVELHWQAPFTHCWPETQGLPRPQRQLPALLQLSALITLHAVQPTPLMPQLANADGKQLFDEQQPPGQELGVHWQLPLTHCCPEAQGPFAPQRQAPADEQVSALMPQTPQLRPSMPQAAGVLPGLQLPPWQQPPLQAVWLAPPQEPEQVCVTVLQLCPVGQSLKAVQPQVVPERQRWPLALVEQSMQARPLAPQLESAVPRLQLPPAQQPALQGWPLLHDPVQVLAET
jgi:hypothetical protein